MQSTSAPATRTSTIAEPACQAIWPNDAWATPCCQVRCPALAAHHRSARAPPRPRQRTPTSTGRAHYAAIWRPQHEGEVSSTSTAARLEQGGRGSGDHPGKVLQTSLCPLTAGCAAHAGGALRSSRKMASDSLARITSLRPARQHPCVADTVGPDRGSTKVGKRGVEGTDQAKTHQNRTTTQSLDWPVTSLDPPAREPSRMTH